jgi:hypothetical protein
MPRAKTAKSRGQSLSVKSTEGYILTVVAHDQSVGGEELLVKDLLHVGLVTILVRIDEDDVKLATERLDGVLGIALDQVHAVTELVLVDGALRSRNHLGVQLQSDDLGVRLLGSLVPSQRAVSGVAADFKD